MEIVKIALSDGENYITEIIPAEGMLVLSVPRREVIITGSIYLSKNESPDDYLEITREEGQKILDEQTDTPS